MDGAIKNFKKGCTEGSSIVSEEIRWQRLRLSRETTISFDLRGERLQNVIATCCILKIIHDDNIVYHARIFLTAKETAVIFLYTRVMSPDVDDNKKKVLESHGTSPVNYFFPLHYCRDASLWRWRIEQFIFEDG